VCNFCFTLFKNLEMGSTEEELRLDFEFSNTFTSQDKKKEVPVFLRHRGIQGSLRASNVAKSGGLDKVKLVLRGMEASLCHDFVILLIFHRIFG
jgi:hypothetical protein